MKTVLISLSLIITLLTSQFALADDESSNPLRTNAAIDTIVVVAQAEAANFEVYSLDLAQAAIDSALNVMASTLPESISANASNIVDVALKLGSSI